MKTQTLFRCQQDLVIGIDLAKKKHVAVALGPAGKFSKPFSFGHCREGFEQLGQWVRQCQRSLGGRSVVVGFESTAHYGRALECWLTEQPYVLRMVSTLNTKRAKEMLDNSPLKTDAKDAAVIADLVVGGKSRPFYRREEVFENLRGLAELFKELGQQKTQQLNRLHRVLDHLFPELPGLFSDLEGKAIQSLLGVAPTPEKVLALGLDELTRLLEKASRKRLGREKAETIWKAASTSIACARGVLAQHLELPGLLSRIEELSRQRSQVEREMVKLLGQVEYACHLLSVPGLGKVTLAVILGEVGDLRNYENAKQVLKMAGLNLYEKSSGQQQGQPRIAKRGRAYLRCILYLAAVRMMKEGQALHDYRLKHQQKAKPKLLVAGMRKLVKLLFALAKENRPYEKKVIEFKPVKVSGTELAA